MEFRPGGNLWRRRGARRDRAVAAVALGVESYPVLRLP